ncbi:phage major capsid protein [Mycobacterium asiaticum]|uniref:phage major capsid protein n=1 Tax=Mycobacterium asiaticum TaxID=1790 RepID=UPI0009C187EB|nr:phage major capsid protein [Mycobacterium asiaticum]
MTRADLTPAGGLDALLGQLLENRQAVSQQRTRAQNAAEALLLEARADGRERLRPAEDAEYRYLMTELRGHAADLQQIDDRIRELRADTERAGQITDTLARLRDPQTTTATSETSTAMRSSTLVRDEHLTYRRNDRKTSWVRDLILHQIGQDDSGEARQRLMRHGDEVKSDPAYKEYRDLSRIDGQGGYAVPPAWLMDQYVELARPGRAFANLVQRLPLPGGTDSINIPKILTGTSVALQTADNTQVEQVDLTDTFINAPVRTIAGQQGVSIQLIDQSPIAFDDVVFRDLVAAHAAVTDTQVLSGTGNSGQVLGVDHTAGITTVAVSDNTIQGFYSALANAIQLVHTTRFLPPEVIIMHPRRFAWLQSLLDGNDRPLVLPYSLNPQNAAGVLTEVAAETVVGSMMGLPVVTDPNVTTHAGAGSPTGTEDVVYVARTSDILLWESGIRARVLPETKAQTLTVILQIFGYLAFTAARYPQSVVTITGLQAPTF